jgi:hypothetical protein
MACDESALCTLFILSMGTPRRGGLPRIDEQRAENHPSREETIRRRRRLSRGLASRRNPNFACIVAFRSVKKERPFAERKVTNLFTTGSPPVNADSRPGRRNRQAFGRTRRAVQLAYRCSLSRAATCARNSADGWLWVGGAEPRLMGASTQARFCTARGRVPCPTTPLDCVSSQRATLRCPHLGDDQAARGMLGHQLPDEGVVTLARALNSPAREPHRAAVFAVWGRLRPQHNQPQGAAPND